jgi:hypothetical protein
MKTELRSGLAIGAAVVAVALSASMEAVTQLNPPQDEILGTWERFLGTTGGTLLSAAAILLLFPAIFATRALLAATLATIVGWVFIELGAASFSLGYDEQHLGRTPSAFSDSSTTFFVAGYLLLALAVAAFILFTTAKRTAPRWVAAVLAGTIGVIGLLVLAVVVRLVLPVLALAVLVLAIVVWRSRSSAGKSPVPAS